MFKQDVQLHEAEVMLLLPHVIDKSGHKSERHRLAFKHALETAGEVIAPNRLCAVLLQVMRGTGWRKGGRGGW